jgi:uncharacterized protein YwqG
LRQSCGDETPQLRPNEAIVSSETDLSALTVSELVQVFVDTIQFRKTITHIGRSNRLTTRIWNAAEELKARDPALNCFRVLLSHPDREVRYGAAVQFRTVDRALFKEVLADLAKLNDEIGLDAGIFLRQVIRDEESGKDSYGDPDPELSTPSDEAAWQVNHRPPASMSLAQIRRQLARTMSPEFAGRVQSLARPAIGLWPQRPRGDLPVTASRLGGMPHAPPGWSWPTCETEPLFFLGQINCAELRGIPAAKKLPSSGLLAFFADHDAVNGCTSAYEGAFAVFYWTELDRLVPAKPPIELQEIFPLCALAFRPLVDLPDSYSTPIKAMNWDDDDGSAFHDLKDAIRNHGIPEPSWDRIGYSKLFGWPEWVQYESERMAELDRLHGLSLLLQIDAYTDGVRWAEWGDGGSLYFLIRDADLAARRFDRCEFEMQGT